MIQYEKNLVSNNNQLIKIALQNLITKLEYGQRMNNVCSKDLCAVLYDVVQNDDYKIRKWAYHLIVYKQNRALVNRCIHNLKSGFEKMQKILVGYWRLCQDLITRICFTSYIKMSRYKNITANIYFMLYLVFFKFKYA